MILTVQKRKLPSRIIGLAVNPTIAFRRSKNYLTNPQDPGASLPAFGPKSRHCAKLSSQSDRSVACRPGTYKQLCAVTRLYAFPLQCYFLLFCISFFRFLAISPCLYLLFVMLYPGDNRLFLAQSPYHLSRQSRTQFKNDNNQ